RQTQIIENDLLCEVKWYLDEPIAIKTTNFPNLSAMAQDFLVIPATSIISEQMFSCAGCIIDNSCALLDINTIATRGL
ncbi:40820_t:CDS:2, partial [Gigaspora margarita]